MSISVTGLISVYSNRLARAAIALNDLAAHAGLRNAHGIVGSGL